MTEEKGALLYSIAKFIDTNGKILIQDDINDLGYFSYSGREKGDPKIGWGTGNHESPFHHWQLGLILRTVAHVMGQFAVMEAVREEAPILPFKELVDSTA